jgi:transcriptional regulator with GAF, ATPase, and Fis domain
MQPLPRPAFTVGDELTAVYARLSGVLLTEQTVETALALITSLARDTLAGSLGSGVTLLGADGQPTTSASTDPLTDDLDRLQYNLEQGPCLAAWAASTVVKANDLAADERWPLWSPQAAALGVRSVMSASMEAGGTSWGAVKVYAKTADAYDERAEEILRRLADQAAIFVSNVDVARSAKRIGDEVKTTLRTRDVIATATGIMMSRKGLEHEDAYRHLLSLARSAGIPLAELAERILAAPVRPRTDHD